MIDPDSDRPLADWLRERILSGKLAPSDQLPAEEYLAGEHELHRSTVHRAMSTLRTEGLVEYRHGKGTFVREAPAEQVIVVASGAVVRVRMPTPQEQRRLDIAEGVPVLAVDHDGETTLYPADRCVLRAGGARWTPDGRTGPRRSNIRTVAHLIPAVRGTDQVQQAARRVTGGRPDRYPGRVTHPGHDARDDTAELFAAVGITVTEAGKARARARLAAADAAWTPERWAALREQLGLPGRAS